MRERVEQMSLQFVATFKKFRFIYAFLSLIFRVVEMHLGNLLNKQKHLVVSLQKQIHLSVDLQCHLGIAVLCVEHRSTLLPLICQIISMRDVTFLTYPGSQSTKCYKQQNTTVKVPCNKSKSDLVKKSASQKLMALVYQLSKL